MYKILLLCLLTLQLWSLTAQQAFPVKVDDQWGLMNAAGEIIVNPSYEAIGEFKRFGYAIMQRDKGVGIINEFGREIIPPGYEDLKILDSTLFAVRHQEDWMVIDLSEKVILEKGYEQVQVWKDQFLGYRQEGLWGVKTVSGQVISPPVYEELSYTSQGYFNTILNSKKGLLSASGGLILPPEYDKIAIVDDQLFFCQKDRKWGAVNQAGKILIPVGYDGYQKLSDYFYRLEKNNLYSVYAVQPAQVITTTAFDNFYPFSRTEVLSKKDRLLGLINDQGDEILPPSYNEIQPFAEGRYRIRKGKKWGIISEGLVVIMPVDMDYIARPVKNRAVIRKAGRFGAINLDGTIVVPMSYDRIEWQGTKALAYNGEAMTLYDLGAVGDQPTTNEFEKHFTITIGGQRPSVINDAAIELDPDFQIEDFEWFYSSADDKWGLRRLSDGSIKIEPSFHTIRVEHRHGMTIVGIEHYNYYNFEKTRYRFDMIYGVVNNKVGLLVTDVNLWDIRLSDFDQGSRVARCIFSSGRHGLISNNPIGLFVKKDYAYIGEFHGGVARMSVKGKVSGKLNAGHHRLEPLRDYLNPILSNNYMIDYTLYDQEFEQEASLVCEGCTFGYLDTVGQVVVEPQFSLAGNFINKVGIVQGKNKKWGMVNGESKMLIPCKFDRIGFLENTEKKIICISNNNKRYGVIDTLGKVVVDLKYDAIGVYKDGRLAVKRNGKWGFVDINGVEIVPCRYAKVNNFSNKIASVKLDRKWGFIDEQGNVIIDFKFREVGNFSDGLAWVRTVQGTGYINEQGAWAIPVQYDKAFDFENKVARVVVNGEWGLINLNGNYFLKPKYSDITKFSPYGTAVVRHGNGNFKYSLINRTGNILTHKKYKSLGTFSEGMAPVNYKGKYGFINHKGKLIIDAKYSRVAGFHNHRAMVQREGLCGYVNLKGEEVVDLQYSKCLDFMEDRAVVYHGYRQGGIIDTAGNYIVEPGVNRLLDFSNGHALVRDQHYRFYYFSEGTRQSDSYYQQAGEFRYGVAVVQKDNRWGIINQRGIEVIPPKYDKIEAFQDGYAIIRIKQFSGLTNLKGEIIIQPNYEYISYAGNGLFRIEQGDKIGYFSAAGKWVWELRE